MEAEEQQSPNPHFSEPLENGPIDAELGCFATHTTPRGYFFYKRIGLFCFNQKTIGIVVSPFLVQGTLQNKQKPWVVIKQSRFCCRSDQKQDKQHSQPKFLFQPVAGRPDLRAKVFSAAEVVAGAAEERERQREAGRRSGAESGRSRAPRCPRRLYLDEPSSFFKKQTPRWGFP